MDYSQKPKIGSRTPRCQGLDQSQLLSMVYGGTTKGIRQIGANEILRSFSNENQSSGRISHRAAPTYKTPEEYYDEVISLKKHIQDLNSENSLLKLKVRRIEEECIKQQKQVEQLLDPTKNDEIRRNFSNEKTSASNSVITSLKQKVFKLEQKLKDKESELQQLQSNIKTTKIDEFNIMLESLYKEINRLKNEQLQESGNNKLNSTQNSSLNSNKKMNELKATILKISSEKNQLQISNRSLKEDMQKCIESQELLKKELDLILKREKNQLTNRSSRNESKEKLLEDKYNEEISSNKKAILKLEDEKRNLERKLKIKDTNINELRKKIDQFESHIDQSSNKKSTNENVNKNVKDKRTPAKDKNYKDQNENISDDEIVIKKNDRNKNMQVNNGEKRTHTKDCKNLNSQKDDFSDDEIIIHSYNKKSPEIDVDKKSSKYQSDDDDEFVNKRTRTPSREKYRKENNYSDNMGVDGKVKQINSPASTEAEKYKSKKDSISHNNSSKNFGPQTPTRDKYAEDHGAKNRDSKMDKSRLKEKESDNDVDIRYNNNFRKSSRQKSQNISDESEDELADINQ